MLFPMPPRVICIPNASLTSSTLFPHTAHPLSKLRSLLSSLAPLRCSYFEKFSANKLEYATSAVGVDGLSSRWSTEQEHNMLGNFSMCLLSSPQKRSLWMHRGGFEIRYFGTGKDESVSHDNKHTKKELVDDLASTTATRPKSSDGTAGGIISVGSPTSSLFPSDEQADTKSFAINIRRYLLSIPIADHSDDWREGNGKNEGAAESALAGRLELLLQSDHVIAAVRFAIGQKDKEIQMNVEQMTERLRQLKETARPLEEKNVRTCHRATLYSRIAHITGDFYMQHE
eukprot:GHVS01009351.1.p1 GENE.GHVS01009351.1~~GHVS01009351.1.p1  ORF type:complete len:286 (-),score=33.68 GHVS01009351.1:844-1701(-)